MDTKKQLKQLNEFRCIDCGFITQLKCNYNSHLTTAKHIRITSGNIKPIIKFICNCGKEYKNRHTLSRHRKNCRITAAEPEPEPANINMTMILDIIKENQEIKNILKEQCNQVMEQNKVVLELQKDNNMLMNKLVEREPGNNNNNTTNNINQKFNLNFFLNETCKDAMNINEFLENIKITFQDLLMIGNSGFVNGVSDIFIKQLRDLEITKRPLHCTDIKRETIHFKEDDIWNRDNTDNSKLKNIISKVEYKNVVALKQWCNDNPDALVNNTDNNLLKDKIYLQTLQGDERTRDKIIKNISKEIIIDKEY
jgi:hypothetical protein